MMRGHNETPMRLDMLADDIRQGWASVEAGEAQTIDGWLKIGHAMNEARSLFPSNDKFGKWVSDNLSGTANDHERAAAMWAAANADQFSEARAAGNARTVRGIHAKWKEIEAERQKAAQAAKAKEEADRKKAEAEAARKEVEEQERAEKEARRAAAAAKTEEARKEAEQKADKAAAAKAEAEKAAEEAASVPVEPVDPNAAARKELSSLSREGLEDELIGLREENKDLRSRVSSQRSEIADLKARIKELTEGDAGRTIGGLQRRLTQSEGRSKEHQAKLAKETRRANFFEDKAKKLEKQVEDLKANQVIQL